MVGISLGFVVHVCKGDMGSEVFKSLARYAIPLFKQGAKVVGNRALQAATEVGQDVLQGKNVRESVKSCRKQAASDVAKNAVKKVMTGKGRKKGV